MKVNEIGDKAADNGRPENARLLVLTPNGDRLVDNVEDLVDDDPDTLVALAENDDLDLLS